MLTLLSNHRIKHRRVLLRTDFNVPIVRGRVASDFRIRSHFPTLKRLLGDGNLIIILSHHSDSRQTLAPVAHHLEKLMGEPIFFLRNPFDRGAALRVMKHGARIVLAENLRFWPGEEREALSSAKKLARLGDVFVNDAFAVAHRCGASITVLPRLLPSAMGLLFEREIREFDRILKRPARPLVAVFGGAKVETKILLLRRFIRRAEHVLVGGATANALLRSRGIEVGRSNAGGRVLPPAVRAIARSKNIILPVDAVVRTSGSRNRNYLRTIEDVGRNEIISDAGPKTRLLFRKSLKPARTIIWNGPVGLTEIEAFRAGSLDLVRALARSRARVVVGGGDTVAFLESARLLNAFSHVSTGGGAMLAYLSGEKLPALEALRRSKRRL